MEDIRFLEVLEDDVPSSDLDCEDDELEDNVSPEDDGLT
jgi:hypothetical protein